MALYDADVNVKKFAEYFNKCYTCNSERQMKNLQDKYYKIRKFYYGLL